MFNFNARNNELARDPCRKAEVSRYRSDDQRVGDIPHASQSWKEVAAVLCAAFKESMVLPRVVMNLRRLQGRATLDRRRQLLSQLEPRRSNPPKFYPDLIEESVCAFQ